TIAGMGADVVVSSALTGGAEVARVDPRTGRAAWTVDVTSPTVVGAEVQAPTVQVFGDQVVVDSGAQVWDLSGAGVVVGHWSGLPTSTTWSIWRTTGGHLLRATFAPFGGDVTVTDLATGVRVVTTGTVRDLVGVDDGSAPGLLLVGGARLTAWDLATGVERWHVDGAADSVVVLGGTVYSVSSGALRAQDAETGAVRWTSRNHYGPAPSLETDGQSLYVATLDPTFVSSTLRAVSTSDGSIIWTSPLTGASVSLLELGGRLFTTTPGGRLTALG
ncbi:MAG TPA: PQQ-binding-like beta-propeller repeat protein, partial [Cellulomonadaceae bacterium]|nr:PQQ-binding-like beta-propeller repeat protein [Cellulomonadaceae bacterium]